MKDQIISSLPLAVYLHLRRLDYRISRPKQFENLQRLRREVAPNGSTYKCFDEKRAIFVHIPKCAGISVNESIFGCLAGGHTTLDQYVDIFEPHSFKEYFKFSFVRNPWDRVASAYAFLKQGGLNAWDKEFYQREISHYTSFTDFVLSWVNERNILKYHHFKPQYLYLFDRYFKATVDYVGHVETIDDDYANIADAVGVKNPLRKTNSSNKKHYCDYYDDDTRSVIAEVYKDDISLLKYSYEGPSPKSTTLDPNIARSLLGSAKPWKTDR